MFNRFIEQIMQILDFDTKGRWLRRIRLSGKIKPCIFEPTWCLWVLNRSSSNSYSKRYWFIIPSGKADCIEVGFQGFVWFTKQ